MSDKLRAAALAALEWLRDERLDTWTYMDRQFYKDRDKQAEALEAALAEPTVKESLIAQRPWVGLTDDEINKEAKEKFVDYNFMSGFLSGASFAEAKLKEKNT